MLRSPCSGVRLSVGGVSDQSSSDGDGNHSVASVLLVDPVSTSKSRLSAVQKLTAMLVKATSNKFCCYVVINVSCLFLSSQALVYLNIMKLSSINSNRGARAFKFFEDDNITESAMIDDTRQRSDEWDSRYERFSDSTANV